jgi:hypothetical protein
MYQFPSALLQQNSSGTDAPRHPQFTVRNCRLRNFTNAKYTEINFILKSLSNFHSGTESAMADEYCWAITQAPRRARCSRFDSSVLECGFNLNPCSVLRRCGRIFIVLQGFTKTIIMRTEILKNIRFLFLFRFAVTSKRLLPVPCKVVTSKRCKLYF